MSHIANRYAKALYQESHKQGVLEDTLKALAYVCSLANELPEFKAFLNNPLLSYNEQRKVLHALFEGRVPVLVLTFLDFISSKRRLKYFIEITLAFEDMHREANGQIIMKAVSAHVLDDAFKQHLSKKISLLTGKKVIGEYSIDRSIIGGIKVWASGRLYEYSFKNELQDYKRKALQNV